MNGEKNLLGRVLALALLLGAAYGLRSIARGGLSCPLGYGSSCVMDIPAAALPPAVDAIAPPVEKLDPAAAAGEDEDAKLEAKAPVAPPPAGK
jgi:hypothetical protein